MKFNLPKIYPITDTRLSGLTHLEQVRRLMAGGASMIQLRDKTAAAGEFYRAAVACIEHAHLHGAKIIINDRADIALAAGADGVHIGQDDLSPIHVRDLLGPDAIVGFSTHSVEQAGAALSLPIDYLAFGPIFTTSTKSDHDPVVGLEGLRLASRGAREVPLVAIGGIDAANAASVFAAGADCAAVISYLASHPEDLEARMHRLLNTQSEGINLVGNG